MSDDAPDWVDLRFAAAIAETLERALGRKLTPEERARCHQHVATARAISEAETSANQHRTGP